MQYSDTTGKTGLLQRCELYTNLGDGAITGNATLKAQFTSLINSAYQKVVSMILASQDDWDWDDSNNTDYPIATTPLVAAQRDYTFPTALNVLKIKRVDVTYDGSTWYKAEAFDSGDFGYGIGNDANMDARFTKQAPKFDLKANSIWIYPLPVQADVDLGAKVRIEFFRTPDLFTTSDTTQAPGIDEAWHYLIALLASAEYAIIRQLQNKNDLSAMAQDGEIRLKQYYGSKDADRSYYLRGAYVDYN